MEVAFQTMAGALREGSDIKADYRLQGSVGYRHV